MKKIKIDGVEYNVNLKTHSGMVTQFLGLDDNKINFYGANVYNIQNSKDLILVPTTKNGITIRTQVKKISAEEYDKISDLYDPYNRFAYHFAIMEYLGYRSGEWVKVLKIWAAFLADHYIKRS